jgi:hypothetical protein
MERDLRMSSRELIDHRWHELGSERFETADANIASRRVGQVFDVAEPLTEFIEYDCAAFAVRWVSATTTHQEQVRGGRRAATLRLEVRRAA